MDKNNKRVCLACGNIHHNGKTCPVIEKKINRYMNSNKQNFLMGNVLLKCIERQEDFFQILSEIAELNEEVYDILPMFSTVLPIEQTVEYFATSLYCKSREFFKETKKTVEEYSTLISECDFEDVYSEDDESGRIEKIHIEFEISSYKDVNTIIDHEHWYCDGYKFLLSKERIRNDEWNYNLYVVLPEEIQQDYISGHQKNKYPDGKVYLWRSMNQLSSRFIFLAADCEGIFKKLFEEELDSRWTDDKLIYECSYEDKRFDIWMNIISKSTKQGLIDWKKGVTDRFVRYYGFYGETEVVVEISLDIECGNRELLYIRNQEGGLGIRFGHLKRHFYGITIGEDEKDEKTVTSNPELVSLCKTIDEYIKEKSNRDILNTLDKHIFEHTNVIVVAQSMICHNREHSIKPLRGIVQLLTEDNKQICYEIYVGYCRECYKYYMFKSDYQELIKYGKPLCALYFDNDKDEQKKYSSFRYKSQSVLNAMGYTVGMDDDLTTDERQKILVDAMQNGLFEIHDLLSFLNWLIKTRETQSKYREAVRKWSEDMKFVEKYEKGKRKLVDIDSIRVK